MALSPEGVNVIVLWAIFGCFLCIVAVGLRFYARHLQGVRLSVNDHAALGGLIFSVALGATVIYACVAGGLGSHVFELQNPPVQITLILKCLVALQILWGCVNTLVRVSICHFYVTIFRLRGFRIAAYSIMTVSVLFLVAHILQTFLFCNPLTANRDRTIPNAKCGNMTAEFISIGTVSLLIDVAIIVLPMPVLWNLQLPIRKKLGLTAIFSIGVFICIISIVQVVALSRINSTQDLTYELGQIAYWSILEPGLGVVNCCLPVLQPVLGKLTGSRIWNSQGDSKTRAGPRSSSSGKAKHRDLEASRAPAGRFNCMEDNGTYPLATKTTVSYQERSGNDEYPDMYQGRNVLVSRDFTIAHENER